MDPNVCHPGAIRRITMENFVTYDQVELFPGPNLNLVIGPNGSGKSTIMCAIILGLGGKTSMIGRGKNLGDFVKRGCKEAAIEIDLCKGGPNSGVVITRNFNTENNSVWSVDKKPTSERSVRQLVESLNVQIDNPCQLLPQDRVKDFSKMNPQQLLRDTMSAISGNSAVTLFEDLITLQNQSTVTKNHLTVCVKQLEEETSAAESLQNTIKEMQQINKMNSDIDICQKKILWCEYDKLVQQLNDEKALLSEAISIKRVNEACLKPSYNKIKRLENLTQKLEKIQSSLFSSSRIWKNQIDSHLEFDNSEGLKIQEIKKAWQDKINQQKSRLRDIEQAKLTLSKIRSDKENLLNSFGNVKVLENEISNLGKPISDIESKLHTENSNKDHLVYEETKIIHEIRLYETRLNTMNDAKENKLKVLKNYSEDTFKALLWLRENRQMFSGNVYEPMILELSFTEQRFTKYVETTVRVRDLLAFTFESIHDMNLFIKKTRGELGLKMTNAICSLPTNESFTHPVQLSDLRSFGFCTYMIDTIIGPKAILNYLCNEYHMHQIPIGNEKTYEYSEKVPSIIKYFYSADHRFFTKTSAYSGTKLTSTTEIRPPKYLVHTIDYDAIKQLENKLNNCKENQKFKKAKVDEVQNKIVELKRKLDLFISKKQKLEGHLEQIRTISSRIRMQENKINVLENSPEFDTEAEKKEHCLQLHNCTENQMNAHKKIVSLFEKVNKDFIKCNIIECKLKAVYDEILKSKKANEDSLSHIATLEESIKTFKSKIQTLNEVTKMKLLEAKNATGGFLPNEDGFPFGDNFRKMPEDLDDLKKHIALLNATLKRMEKVDNRVFAEYDQRNAKIKELQKSIKKATELNVTDKSKIDDLRDKWLRPLEKKIEKINKKFSEMFAKLGCAGQVQLSKNQDKYEMYGIEILVKFRANETLQQLSERQSGGERSIATALYLLALQQFSEVPFRGVDEINQGMDAINEEDMYKFLLELSDNSKPVQYFLITPKLLQNIAYTSKMAVHIVINGPRALQHNEWNSQSFIDAAKRKK